MPSRNLHVVVLAALISVACYSKTAPSRYVAIVAEAMGLIEANYLEPVAARELFEGAMDGMVGSLDDQYSNYISPQDFTEFQQSLDQEFGGIGIVVEVDPSSQMLTIMTPLVNTPAYEAGIQAGDVILEIDSKSTRNMKMAEAITIMRGRPGTPVNLTIRRSGEDEPRKFRVLRAIIPIESVLGDTRRPDGSWNYFLEDYPQIGYIRLTTFGDHTIDEMKAALDQYNEHPIDALILDLRDNAGGYLNAAVAVSDMFISRGRIVSTRGRDATVRAAYEASPSNDLFPADLPMAVLVNTYTASASEIVAACLQDHERAGVVGVRSWGKGTVQNVIEMEGGKSALKLTTASYWRPSGKNIHRTKDASEDGDWGVRPDPGLDVPLEEQTVDRIYQLRQQRDIVLRPGQTLPPLSKPNQDQSKAAEPTAGEGLDSQASQKESSTANAEDEKVESPSEQAAAIEKWSDDPQLRRAIEYVQGKVESKELARKK